MPFQPSPSPKSAQLIPQQLRREPIKALRVWHHADRKNWEVIPDKLSAGGWSWDYCRAMTQHGWRWVVDVRRNDGRRHNTANPHYSSKHQTPKIER